MAGRTAGDGSPRKERKSFLRDIGLLPQNRSSRKAREEFVASEFPSFLDGFSDEKHELRAHIDSLTVIVLDLTEALKLKSAELEATRKLLTASQMRELKRIREARED